MSKLFPDQPTTLATTINTGSGLASGRIPTTDEIVESCRKFKTWCDENPVAVTARFNPLDQRLIQEAKHELRSPDDKTPIHCGIKLLEDPSVWPGCVEMDHSDGSTECLTPVGKFRRSRKESELEAARELHSSES